MTDRRQAVDQRDLGFTLVELLVVITIIGILAGIATLSTTRFRAKGVESACRSDYKSIELAMEAYNTRYGTYPGLSQFDSGLTLLGSKKLPNNPPDYTFTVSGGSTYSISVNSSSTLVGGNTIAGCKRK